MTLELAEGARRVGKVARGADMAADEGIGVARKRCREERDCPEVLLRRERLPENKTLTAQESLLLFVEEEDVGVKP